MLLNYELVEYLKDYKGEEGKRVFVTIKNTRYKECKSESPIGVQE